MSVVRAHFNQGWRDRLCPLHNIVPTKFFVILGTMFWFWEPTYSFQIHTSEWLHIVSLVTIHNSYSEWCLSFYCFSLNANWSSCYKKLLISSTQSECTIHSNAIFNSVGHSYFLSEIVMGGGTYVILKLEGIWQNVIKIL